MTGPGSDSGGDSRRGRPRVLGAVMGPFSRHAERRDWRDLEPFFNPNGLFDHVHVVSMADPHRYETRTFGSVTVHPVPPAVDSGPLRRLSDLMAIRAATRILRELDETVGLDIVAQIYGGPLKFGVPAVLAGRKRNLPVLITLHSDYRRSMEWTYSPLVRQCARVLWRWIFRRVTHVRAVSGVGADFARAHGVPDAGITVIPNKEAIETFRESPSPAEVAAVVEQLDIGDFVTDGTLFLTVGRLFPPKNVDGMLRATRLALDRASGNVRLLIAGDGPDRASLELLRDGLGLEDHVRFLGFVPHSVLRCLYHASDAFLFPTHYEGQPRVVVEAMLSGLPIVCSSFGQVCEVVEDGVDGLWVDPTDVPAIAGAMVRLADDPALRTRMSAHATFDADRFSVERVSGAEERLYRRLTSGEDTGDV